MDPSYNNSFGSFSSGGAEGQAGVVASSSNMGDIMLAPSESGGKKRSWKAILIIVVLVLLVVGGGVLAYYLAGSDFRMSPKEDAEELYSLLGWVSYTDQCPAVTGNVTDLDYSNESYEGDIESCLRVADQVKDLVSRAKNFSSSGEYQTVYAALAAEVSAVMIFGDDLKNIVDLYKLWHSWLLDTSNMTLYQSAKDIEELVKPLKESGNNALSDYAVEWEDKRNELVQANVMFEVYPYDESVAAAYSRVKGEYDILVTKGAVDIDALTGFNKEASDSEVLSLVLLKYRQYVEDNL